MATGTGKTKLAIAMLYRLLAAKRFRRVCFVVDRNALGTQAAGEFSTTRIVSANTFADIFGLEGLKTVKPDMETKVPALAELHEIFLGQAGGSLELVAGKHSRCDTANAEAQKDGSLAYKITPICLVPLSGKASSSFRAEGFISTL